MSENIIALSNATLYTHLNVVPRSTMIQMGEQRTVIVGVFPFTKRFRKFRLGCKWNMIFRFVPLENFPEKVELLKR